MPPTLRFSEDDIVRVSRDLTPDERRWAGSSHFYAGSMLTIEMFVEAGDPEQDEIPVDFYETVDMHGCTVAVPADAVELVMTATQAAARKLPTAERIAEAIQGGVTSIFVDDIDVDETVRSGSSIEAYGRTADGLTFGFTVTVSAPWKTDA